MKDTSLIKSIIGEQLTIRPDDSLPVVFDYILDPAGHIRWFYPRSSKHPTFLSLYSGSSRKAKLYRIGVPFIFRLGGRGKIQHGHFSCLFPKGENWLEKLLQETNCDEYAVFTGTVGENRKAVIALAQRANVKWFYKLPLGEGAHTLVAAEEEALDKLKTLKLRKLRIPAARRWEQGLLQENIQLKGSRSSMELQAIHREALDELYRLTGKKRELQDLAGWAAIKQGIQEITTMPPHPEIPGAQQQRIGSLLSAIQQKLPADRELFCSTAHGDFTPWNMFVSKKQLAVFDWELSATHPAWYDAFHFIFQTGILIRRENLKAILTRIKELMETNELMPYRKEMRFHYQYYLLHIITYYLPRYLRQTELHEQVHWLLALWEEALEWELQ